MATLEFFFDCSSPWTYLAFTRIHAIVAHTRAKVIWKPILVGGVFNTVNRDVYERRANPEPRKSSYYEKDLQDWARLAGIRIGKPPVFPVRATLVMRAVLAADEQGALIAFARTAFESYWGELKDVSQPAIVGEIAAACRLDSEHILKRAQDDDIKARLKTNTDEVISRGGFGSPTMFVNERDMYFGNDRIPLVEAALSRH
jgi:2-hydroxychromene-2-carboxylate isomerase